MNFTVPEKSKFFSQTKSAELIIRSNGHAVFKNNTTSFIWENKVNIPSKVMISEKNKVIYLIGGHGDSGSFLGVIYIYRFDGTFVQKVDLKNHISNLEDMSSISTPFSNFPWIYDLKFEKHEKLLSIFVCEKLEVKISSDGDVIFN